MAPNTIKKVMLRCVMYFVVIFPLGVTLARLAGSFIRLSTTGSAEIVREGGTLILMMGSLALVVGLAIAILRSVDRIRCKDRNGGGDATR